MRESPYRVPATPPPRPADRWRKLSPVFACAVLGIFALAGGSEAPHDWTAEATVAEDCHPEPPHEPPPSTRAPPARGPEPAIPSVQPAPWNVSCPPPPQSPSASLTLERTECYGSCPAYSIEIHGDGQAVFSGRAYVSMVGRVALHLKKPVVDALFAQAACAHPERWKASYSVPISDNPYAKVTISLDGTKPIHVIDQPPCHTGGGGSDTPPALCELEKAIDAAFDRDRYVTCKTPDGNPVRCQYSPTAHPRPPRDPSMVAP